MNINPYDKMSFMEETQTEKKRIPFPWFDDESPKPNSIDDRTGEEKPNPWYKPKKEIYKA
jgi:hypothetical protein